MSYIARRTHPDQIYQWQALYPDGDAVTRLCIESVAEVIAWALNEVAQGHTLSSWSPNTAIRISTYSGPTEGIRE